MRSICAVLVGGFLACAVGSAGATDFGANSSLVAIQITHGVANFASAGGPGGTGYLSAYDHSELGAQIQIWRFYSTEYALTASGGIGFFSETDKPGNAATVGSTDFKYTQTSWQARIGEDRVIHLSDKAHLFVGPGIQYWSGKAKFKGGAPGAQDVETPTTNRWALEGRVGFHLLLKEKVALFSQIGHYFGYATSSENGAKATWWPSGHDGAAGLAFTY